MDRYICIHGHFYQPPRENPWLEAIELQESAYPYHDWNERITAECYAPNSVSRILNGEGLISELVNNYARMSFDFGPTLLSWLENKAPEVYQAILEADRESQRAFSGHGSALAQAYNHMILPLANRRDKRTQVLWGIRDFQHRFGRTPEGMWLPETAVDVETLDILAELGIRFTILSSHQAQRVRRSGSRTWRDVRGGRIDPTMAYELHLPSGRRIALFFYDGPISRSVAFERLLNRGEDFVQRLLDAFWAERHWPQLVHIATDGETYGHHHPHGDMALAYALRYIESNSPAQLINYGEYLEKHPPTSEVEVQENTSWSCCHGVERWRSDCECSTGAHPGWSQAWRAPLRKAMDWLRDTVSPKYEEAAKALLKDPWAARDNYIQVVLNRSPDNVQQFLAEHAVRPLAEAEVVTALKLLELQRHTMLMYTSCGWFFDDPSGIETVQIVQYAGRALQLAREIFGDELEPQFLKALEQAKSNLPEYGDGRRIYETSVRPAMVDQKRVGAHYAVSSLFEDYPEQTSIYCYTFDRQDYRVFEAGRAKLVVGRVKVTSGLTRESAVLSFGVLHLGDHNLSGGVQQFQDERAYEAMAQEIANTFARADFSEIVRLLDKHFGESTYSLRSLFRDEQRRVLGRVLESALAEADATYRQAYRHHTPLMRFLADLGIPLPRTFQAAAEFTLNDDLQQALTTGTVDPKLIQGLLEEARAWKVALDTEGLRYLLTQTLEKRMSRFASAPTDTPTLADLLAMVSIARSLPFEVNLWMVQNLYSRLLQTTYPEFQQRARQGDEAAQTWLTQFISLGKQLSVRVG